MIWIIVALVSALVVALMVKHARIAAPLALLLGCYIGPTALGQMIISALDSVPRLFGA